MAETLKERGLKGVSLTAQSFGFFGHYKWLVVFPLLSLICSCALIAIVVTGTYEVAVKTDLIPTISQMETSDTALSDAMAADNTGAESKALSAAGIAVMFAVSFCVFAIVTFFNVALSACALSIFNGKPMGLGEGLSISMRRLPAIIAWAFTSAVVGSILQAIESRSSMLSRALSIFAGLAWHFATFFAIPLIVAKDAKPIAAISGSVALMRQVWGESLVSNLGMRGIRILIVLAVVGGVFLIYWMFGAHGLWRSLPIVAPFFLVAILFLSTIGTIMRAALYYYATESKAPTSFDSDTLKRAIKSKA